MQGSPMKSVNCSGRPPEHLGIQGNWPIGNACHRV
jgi:hypothetical protein